MAGGRRVGVHRILSDPIYTGTAYANRHVFVVPRKPRSSGPRAGTPTCRRPRQEWIPIRVPSIIDESTHQDAKVQLARNSALSFRNNTRNDYLLHPERLSAALPADLPDLRPGHVRRHDPRRRPQAYPDGLLALGRHRLPQGLGDRGRIAHGARYRKRPGLKQPPTFERLPSPGSTGRPTRRSAARWPRTPPEPTRSRPAPRSRRANDREGGHPLWPRKAPRAVNLVALAVATRAASIALEAESV